MKGLCRKLSVLLAIVLCFAFGGCTVAGSGKDKDKDVDAVDKGDYSQYTKLTIDGGGQNVAYNTTSSLIYDKYTNPYPYNTLERLVEEWNKAHAAEYGYYFDVASSSINNDRETMVPMLNGGTAPEIIYYLQTTIAEDQNKGWFYDLKNVMEQPNKYSKSGEDGSVRWRDLYTDEQYRSFFSPNGQMFTVALEQNPIGILYNKTLFEAAGITKEPETYKEFMEAQDKLNAYAVSVGRGDKNDDSKYICPYNVVYPWYDSFLETSIMGDVMEYMDVIEVDGFINAEEYVRAFMTRDPNAEPDASDKNKSRLYSPDHDRIAELYRLIKQMCKYYPTNWRSYYSTQQFTVGNLAMLEVTGGDIRELIDTVDGDFEVGVFAYPKLETQPQNEPQNDYYTTFNEGNYYVQRGLSGYSTGWAISNSAMNKDKAAGNDKCVNACIDLLMWLSCFENNEKMVNELGFAIPLSGNTTYEYFKPLAELFKSDCENEKALAWSAATAGGAMNKNYYDATYLFRQNTLDSSASIKESLGTLVSSFTSAANLLYQQNGWNMSAWPSWGTSNKN